MSVSYNIVSHDFCHRGETNIKKKVFFSETVYYPKRGEKHKGYLIIKNIVEKKN